MGTIRNIALIGMGAFTMLGAMTFGDDAEEIASLVKSDVDKHAAHQGVAPIVGYDPTYGVVYGGAYFYQRPEFSLGTDFNLNFRKVYKYHLDVVYRFNDDWKIEANSALNQGFDPYYGEGGETNPLNVRDLWGITSRSKLELSRKITPISSIGVFTEVRFRTEQAMPDITFSRQYPNQTNGSVGLTFTVDTRSDKQSPLDGFLFTTMLTYAPRYLSGAVDASDFGQIESALTVYKQILDEILPKTVAAFSVQGGLSEGNPTYMYRYRLGGTTNLRGYLENRFRGDHFYLQQTEIRFPIWKFLGGAGFLGFGDISDAAFTNPKLAYGGGLRIGLPPDWTSQIRIDFARGRDQQGVFVEFGQTF